MADSKTQILFSRPTNKEAEELKDLSAFRRMRNEAPIHWNADRSKRRGLPRLPPSSSCQACSILKCAVSAEKGCTKTCTEMCTETCPVVRIYLRNFECNFQCTPNRQNAQPFLGVSAPPLRCHQPCHSAHAGCRPRPPYHGENHREAGVGTRLGKSTNCKLGGGAEIQHLDSNQ